MDETEYGDAGVCSTCTGQKNKPRVAVQYVDASTMRATEFGYDWRERRTHVHGEKDAMGNLTYTVQTYDNMNRVTKSERFLHVPGSAMGGGSSGGEMVIPDSARLLARTEQFYDERGRVWKTEQSVVNPATGAVNGKLLGQSWYDAAGRVIKQIEPGANHFSKFVYDSLGRVTKTYVATYPSETGYAAASSLTNNTVFTQTEVTYDNLGNVMLSVQIERLSTASTTGALTTSTGRYQYVASWFDGIGRSVATANYGTNNGTALSRPATVPARSDNVLITETKYDKATGRAFRTIDPASKDHRTFFDHLGRTVKTIANYIEIQVIPPSSSYSSSNGYCPPAMPDQNVTVEMTYHPSGQIATLTAKNPTTGDQVTKYVYGTAKAWLASQVQRNDLLAAEIYPDSTNFEDSSGMLQNGASGVVDRVEYRYNRQGEVMDRRDQNGTVRNFAYDNLGRVVWDWASTIGTGVDGTIGWIETAYNVVGNVKRVTSYQGSGYTVMNEVVYEYDSNGLLAKEFSNPSGAVMVATPYIGYTYDTTKSGDLFTKRLRLTAMKYPSNKTLNYAYGTAGSADDLLGRVAEIKDGVTSVAQYAYHGIATPVKTTYPQPGLALDYTVSGALDRFGRIADHAWKKGATDVVRIKHGYDRVGNRTYRTDAVYDANSEVYTYDGVNQIKSLSRGSLGNGSSSSSSNSTMPNFTETWNYDMTGNWLQFNKNGTVENRTHNAANEVQTIATHDKNGNVTVAPDFTGKYDAWNRLVEVRNASDALMAIYSYNGLNQRVKRALGGYFVVTSFFNSAWQELEFADPDTKWVNVWGQRYIDDLVYRDRGAERLYSLADPNWNVVALTNASGTVVERMKYDGFGKVTWLTAAFAAKGSSGYTWNRTFTGQVLDIESGLMLYRNRYYHTGLGRFVTRDPSGYRAWDTGLYRYVSNMPTRLIDSFGLVGEEKCQTCDELLKKAENMGKNTRYGGRSARKAERARRCNVNIFCSDDCKIRNNPAGIGAIVGESGGYLHICIKNSVATSGPNAELEFYALLLHELTHADDIIDKRPSLCQNTKPRYSGDPPSFTLGGSGCGDCIRAEKSAYTASCGYKHPPGKWREYCINAGIATSCQNCNGIPPKMPQKPNTPVVFLDGF